MTSPHFVAAALVTALALTGCATTVDESDENGAAVSASTGADVTDIPEGAQPALEDGQLIEGGVIDDTVPVATTLISGAAADLLPEMAAEMSRLSGLIAEGTTDDEVLVRIEDIWNTIRPQIADSRPELVDGIARGSLKAHGRGYVADDLPIVATMSISAAYVSVLVMALYLNSPAVSELYATPALLWGICLILLYWLSRVAMITHRGHMHDDPVVFAVRDRISLLCVAVVLVIAVAGAQPW